MLLYITMYFIVAIILKKIGDALLDSQYHQAAIHYCAIVSIAITPLLIILFAAKLVKNYMRKRV